MLNDPEKSLEWRVIGIDETDTEEIEMHRPWKMPGGKCLGGTQIDEQRFLFPVELLKQLLWRHQQ